MILTLAKCNELLHQLNELSETTPAKSNMNAILLSQTYLQKAQIIILEKLLPWDFSIQKFVIGIF